MVDRAAGRQAISSGSAEDPTVRNVVLPIQALLVSLCMLGFGLRMGEMALWSAAYGGAVAMVTSWLLGRGVNTASELAKTDPTRGVYTLYFGAVQRFVFVLVALGVGLGFLRLQPIPLLVSFGVAQLGYAFGAGGGRRESTR